MLLALLRALGIAPCPEAASVEAAAAAPPEPDPEADPDADSDDGINLPVYSIEIREQHVVPLGDAHPGIEIYTRSRMHDHPVIPADRPEEQPVYCTTCQMWLNRQKQWDDHIGGKKHRKNMRRERQLLRGIPVE